MTGVKEECIKFAENISVRGIPKVVKSQKYFLKFVWLIATVTCTGILTWQLTTLFQSYFSYPSKSSYGESKEANTFPSVVVCSLHPKLSEIDYDEYLREADYSKRIHKVSSFFNNNLKEMAVEFQNQSENFGIILEAIQFYLISLPKDGPLPNRTIPFLVNYNTFNSHHVSIKSEKCHLVENTFWNAEFYKCHKYQLSESCLESANSMTMIFYTNNIHAVHEDFDENATRLSANGVKVSLSVPDAMVDIQNGIDVGAGSDTFIKLVTNIRRVLDKPYTEEGCETDEFLHNSGGVRYSFKSCLDLCDQTVLLQKCGCIASEFFIPPSLKEESICGNTSLASRTSNFDEVTELKMTLEAISKSNCKEKVLSENTECWDICKPPCKETFFETEVHSLTNWPHISYHKDFFNTFINKYLTPESKEHDYFSDYISMIKDFDDNLTSVEELSDFFQKSNKISSNFLQVTLRFVKSKPLSLIDSPFYTWQSMISMVGGCLSLWLGVTIMTLVETIEFVFNLLEAVKKKLFPSKTSFVTKIPVQ